MRRPLRDINPTSLVKPFRDQFSAAEEARQDHEQALAEEFAWQEELAPDTDPFEEAA